VTAHYSRCNQADWLCKHSCQPATALGCGLNRSRY
jgi:hypothetical protein